MPSTPDLIALAASAAAVRLPVWGVVGDEELVRAQSAAGRLKGGADALVAGVAAEIARRSSRPGSRNAWGPGLRSGSCSS